MNSKHPDGAILTGGLRRVLLCAIIGGCALAAVQIAAVSKLQREIDLWAWTSEVTASRERLLSRTHDKLDPQIEIEMAEVVDAFEDLRRATLADVGLAENDRNAMRFAALQAEARGQFVRAEAGREALVPFREAIGRSVALLQDLSASWATQLRAEEQGILRRSERIDARSREIDALKSTLTSVLIDAQLLQQQVIAVERLIDTSSEEITRSSIASLDASDLPSVCAPNETETAERICSPSIARVLSALERLQTGEPSEIRQNVNSTILGLQGYIRAGQARLDLLSNESADALTRLQDVRRSLSELGEINSSLSRINRVLQDLRSALDREVSTAVDLEIADRQVRSYTSQAQLRMAGLLRIYPTLEGDPRLVLTITATILENWTAAHDIAAERIGALTAFGGTMSTLSSEIATHADQVRRDTMLWVNLYATSFLVLAGLLIASTIGLVLLARRRFIGPLSRVTGTIIGLARGELQRPVVLPERAFGFDTLGKALEQLRLEMVERHLLAERNKEQQTIIASNLEEMERTSREMAWMAMHDALTGLGNRRRADLDLENLTRGDPSAQTDYCVMQIDIDRFKAVNDALGHPAGDFVLKTVSGILKTCAGPEANCYRIGGDEFLVVLFGEIGRDQAGSIAAQLIQRINEPMEFNGHRCNVGASIGIAFGRDAGFDAMQVVINADLALYQVKRTGRGVFKFFTEDLATLTSRRKDLSDRLLAAMERKAFLPYYQPQFDAKTRALRGVEVLCRWHDEDLGWIPPGEFLTVAEELDAVGEIDEILFEKVAEDLQTLTRSGLSLPKVSFNITADRLLKAGLARELSGRIGVHTTIALELLESMSLDNPPESVRWAIDDLREHGIEIEIDDFGSDRASLVGLMAISPQAMKIDRAIVIPIVDSLRHRDLVKKIIDIGTALNIEVVAEGVETEEHAALLASLGCDVLQGFGLARPMPFGDFLAFCGKAPTEDTTSSAVA